MRRFFLIGITFALACFCLGAARETTVTATTEKDTSGNAVSNIQNVADKIQNAFKFILLSKEPVATTTPTHTSPSSSLKENNGYSETTVAESTDYQEFTTDPGFITVFETTDADFNDEASTTTKKTYSTEGVSASSRIWTTTVATEKTKDFFRPSSTPEKLATTSKSRPKTTIGTTGAETTEAGFITVYETTSFSEDETTGGSEFESTTTTRTVNTRLPTLATRRPTTTTRSTTKESKKEDTVFKTTSGVNFIMKSTTSPRTTERTTTKKTSATEIVNKYETKETTGIPELSEEDYTTEQTNDSAIIGAAQPGVIPGADISFGGPVVAAEVDVAFHFAHSGIFWARYWYWILIAFLLIILFFIIPGFFCQVYLSKWCRKRKLERFFEKKTHSIFDFERIGFGLGKTQRKSEDAESGGQGSFSSSGTSSGTGASKSGGTSSRPSNDSVRFPASSLPEADIRQQSGVETKPQKKNISLSENATIVVIPDPMRQVRTQRFSTSNSLDPEANFDFPQPANDGFRALPIGRGIAPSMYSQSDIGLDIGNETIIKSNKMTKPQSPKQVTACPVRPPKPQHMKPVSQPLEIAPSNRPRQNSPTTSQKGHDEQQRHQAAPRSRGRKKQKPITTSKRKDKSRKSRSRKRVKKRGEEGKKTESTTQAIMQAAKGLEDILESITKLTREYPIPDLMETAGENGKAEKPRREKRRRPKPPEKTRKSPTRKSKNEDHERNLFPDEDMLRRKEKRTKNWANEQRKMERARDKKLRNSSRKRKPKDSKRKKKKPQKEALEISTAGGAEPSAETKKKIPTLVKEEIHQPDRIKQERGRMRLERDLKKLQRYHNAVEKKSKDPIDKEPK